MNFDRFQPPATYEELPVFECSFCGFEIYQGDVYYEEDGQIACNDTDCIARLARLEKRIA